MRPVNFAQFVDTLYNLCNDQSLNFGHSTSTYLIV